MEPNEKLALLAPNLASDFPRSPRQTLAGYVIAARTLDKCRATVAGTEGEYHYNCPLDRVFFEFTGIDADEFRQRVAQGATDEEMATFISEKSKITERREIIAWNNKHRYMRPCDMPIELQEFLEDYIPQFIPKNRPVYYWFDVYDLEEERI